MNTKKAEQVLNRFIDFYRDVRKACLQKAMDKEWSYKTNKTK